MVSKRNWGQLHHKQIVRLLVTIDFDTILDELDHDYLILLVIQNEIYFFKHGLLEHSLTSTASKP